MSYRTQIARDKLVALGTCIGKLTHTGKFRLTVGALDIISQYAKYKVSDSPSPVLAVPSPVLAFLPFLFLHPVQFNAKILNLDCHVGLPLGQTRATHASSPPLARFGSNRPRKCSFCMATMC